jgi:antitoxin MazE
MQLSIAKWGNSLALRLPSHIAKEGRLEEGTPVTIKVQEDGSITITPTRRRFKLSDLLANHPERGESAEVEWGRPKGEEAW